MARRRSRSKPTPQARAAWVTLYEETIFQLMMGLVKSKPMEARYARFRDRARGLTQEELHRIARAAGEYVVEHANPAPMALSRDEIHNLTEAAIEHALTLPAA